MRSDFMRRQQTANIIVLLLLLSCLTSCGKPDRNDDVWVSFIDTVKGGHGYKNQNGDVVIPPGTYSFCFTDTFRTYALVAKPHFGLAAIDRQGNVLYKVFPYDNGPDYPSDGLFRIMENTKIGFADSKTGRIVIQPRFDCAFPFENGVARVSVDCRTQADGEHNTWFSETWYYIDKTGKKVGTPKRVQD